MLVRRIFRFSLRFGSKLFEQFSVLKQNQAVLDDPNSKSTWVEKHDLAARKRWFQFVAENIRLPREQGKLNWFDQFESSVDLKRIVQRHVNELRSGVTL